MILILFRLTGKRALATVNMFDFVVLFLLSNVAQDAIIGSDNRPLGGIISAARRLSLQPVDVEHAIRVRNGDDVTEAATSVMEPNRQPVLTLKKEKQSASKGDIAGLSAQLKAIQASPELPAASQ